MFNKIQKSLRWRLQALRSHADWDEKIEILPDDIFLVSYPRSGNTWMRFMLASLMESECEWNHSNINEIIPDMYQTWKELKHYTSPRIIKSHEVYNKNYHKVVYIYRDIRDVAVSYYNHDVACARQYKGSFQKFLVEMLDGDVPFGSWQDHVRSWIATENNKKHVLAVRYESLWGDTERALAQIASFVGLQVSLPEVRKAIEKTSFQSMQDSVRKYSPYCKTGHRLGVKGGPGKWEEVLSDTDLQFIQEKAGDEMEMLGYPLM